MDKNYQNRTNHKLVTIEDKIWLPSTYTNNNKPPPVSDVPKKKGVNWGFADKSFWEWLLLIGTLLAALGAIAIPFAVTILGLNFTQQQHQTDLQIAQDQQQAAILQTYLDNIQDLLLNHNLLKSDSFHSTNPYYDVAILARARTLTALHALDPGRKAGLIIFLYEARLIGFYDSHGDEVQSPIIDLAGADLTRADFTGADLSDADLSDANLSGAILSGAILGGTDLDDADLSEANLRGTFLSEASLRGVNFSNANLSDATLIDTKLDGANFSSANLSGTDLDGAQFVWLHGSEAINLTQQQLDQVNSCRDAVLPRGPRGSTLICHRN